MTLLPIISTAVSRTQLIPQITGHWSQSGHWTHSRTWTRDGSGGAAAATLRGVRPICGEWRGYAETSVEWPSPSLAPLFVFVPLFAGDISDIFSLLATHCITLTKGTPVDTINTLVSTKTFYSAKNLIFNSLSERRGLIAKAKCFSCVLYRFLDGFLASPSYFCSCSCMDNWTVYIVTRRQRETV